MSFKNNSPSPALDKQSTKFYQRRGRYSNTNLKDLCHERGLSTEGTKAELLRRLIADDRRPEQVRREEKLKMLLEDKFKKTRRSEAEGLGLGLAKLDMKKRKDGKRGRKRSSTFPPHGVKLTSGEAGATENRFAGLSIVHGAEDGEGNKVEVERSPEAMLANSGLSSVKTAPSMEDIVSRQMNELKLGAPNQKQDVDGIVSRVGQLPMSTICKGKGAGGAMSWDFTNPVRGDV